jgi:hypothetical protein
MMKTKLALIWVLTLVSTSICASLATAQSSDPLPSWNQGKAKQLSFLKTSFVAR